MALSPKLNRLLREYRNDYEAFLFRGAGHPDDREIVEHNFKVSDDKLRHYLGQLEGKAACSTHSN